MFASTKLFMGESQIVAMPAIGSPLAGNAKAKSSVLVVATHNYFHLKAID
jgi:hypothetical protein